MRNAATPIATKLPKTVTLKRVSKRSADAVLNLFRAKNRAFRSTELAGGVRKKRR